ncbi:MAG: hypothetical protein EA343_17485, partial [Nodularia sp. (in: Bacteria)]
QPQNLLVVFAVIGVSKIAFIGLKIPFSRKIIPLSVWGMLRQISQFSERSLSTFFAEMVIFLSQLPKDLSLMILTNFLPLWNETALGARGDQNVMRQLDETCVYRLAPL